MFPSIGGRFVPVFSDIRQRQLAIQAIRNLLIEEPLITIDQDIPFTIQQEFT